MNLFPKTSSLLLFHIPVFLSITLNTNNSMILYVIRQTIAVPSFGVVANESVVFLLLRFSFASSFGDWLELGVATLEFHSVNTLLLIYCHTTLYYYETASLLFSSKVSSTTCFTGISSISIII